MLEDPRQVAILEDAQNFVKREVRPFAGEFDETGVLSTELIRKMAKKGYLGATFPEQYGGLQLDPVYYGLLTEEFGQACCSTRALLTVQTSLVGETILKCGNQQQKEQWLPSVARGEKIGAFALSEPNIGSDAKHIECKYKKNGDIYVISGQKKWISFAGIADFFVVIAQCDEVVSAFIVEHDRDGVSTTAIKGLMAAKACHIAEIDLENVEVPAGNLLGREGGGFTYVVGTALDHGRYSIAWAGLAVAQEATSAMVTYARNREQFGKKIHEFELIQGLIADAVTKVHAARTLCMHAGELRRNRQPKAIAETYIAKYFTSKVAVEVAADAVQVHGGAGFTNHYPVERLYRESKVLEVIEGTSQIQQTIISRFGLKEYFRSP